MRVAVTGASGFVGQHVLHELQSRDLEIVAISRTTAGPAFDNGRIEFVQMDIAEAHANPIEKMGSPDVLIHLAWDGLPNYQSPAHMEIELPRQRRFLTSCLDSGLERLVVTGTCFEYGRLSGEIFEYMPANPCTQYGAAKDALHNHLKACKTNHAYQLSWLRLFYLFGPGQSKASLYSLLMNAIHRGDTDFDMSGGEQIRDFLPIEEAARAIVDLAMYPSEVGTVNVCSGKPTSVRKLVEEWIRASKSHINMKLGCIPYSDIEPMHFWGNCSKLNRILKNSSQNLRR
ncbi:dTDP-6-deoxy-L-talose 4-dehydrogenase (NAD+) [Rhodanobacter sp. K2T2]|uniref:NAD-dependent epimerase/dehydratase family protein n=1 Tax=Rhodanobacter sp. K2T2 TaxID=2723085 RepID=UPI0015CE51ED|nr:NAD-dependent epimerase/dehydratase family protein [Rhodanobacter sp. K2T2]NYE28079.1 dTDP-6-deoxy-L-talose 4-dehydrogenase (NAD+) [Rhodanobacter sp. K2T2]